MVQSVLDYSERQVCCNWEYLCAAGAHTVSQQVTVKHQEVRVGKERSFANIIIRRQKMEIMKEIYNLQYFLR